MFADRLARRIRCRFGVASAGFVIRRRFSLSGLLVGCLLLAACACSFSYFSEVGMGGGVEVEVLRRQVLLQSEELRVLRAQIGGGQSLVEMERSSRSEMLAKVRNLEQENAALKEDMLLFERLVPSFGEEASVRIESFRVRREVEGQFRYRWLVGYRPSRLAPEFHGRIQIMVILAGEGGGRLLMLPEADVGAPEYRLDVKSFARGEGRFGVPYGSRVTAVELRVLQNNVVKAKRLEQLQELSMFGRKEGAKPAGRIDTLIGAGTRIEGDIVFSGGLRIDGEVRGSVFAADGASTSTLVLSEMARVEGAVSVAHLVSNGVISGAVVVKESLELQSRAKIVGDVEYALLEMHQGAVIEGRLVCLSAKLVELKSDS